MTDTTPISEGALTVDNQRDHVTALGVEQFMVRLGDDFFAWASADERDRLLAHQPDRPTGVPDAVRLLIERWRDQAIVAASTQGMPNAPAQPSDYDVWTCAAELAGAFGAPWLPYQPDPDPADSPTVVPPASGGERTEPLGLSEGDRLIWNDLPVTFIKDDRGSRLIECENEERVWVDPSTTEPVAEWDAEPQPAGTIDDIVAGSATFILARKADERWMRSIYSWGDDGMTTVDHEMVRFNRKPEDANDPTEEVEVSASMWHAIGSPDVLRVTICDATADRIEAATHADPDPDTITVNLPEMTARYYACGGVPGSMDVHIVREACRAAVAGLPEEPTDGGES